MPNKISINHQIALPGALAVDRTASLFAKDIEQNLTELHEQINSSRILVIGGAGSIGASTIHTVSLFGPEALHVVDHNENGLAELVRGLRSREQGLSIPDFRTLPLNYGNSAFYHFLASSKPYDYILNFAALKHVRSEKDSFSLMEMLNTNLLLMSDLMERLCDMPAPKRFFSVSTDKAANPSSMMGASKRLMEHFLFNKGLMKPKDMTITSARFANVAYSNGSLLQSFNNRLDLRQPLVAPAECERYFVSLEESGHICALGAFLVPENAIAIPKLDPQKHLVKLENVLFDFLKFKNLTPKVFEDEHSARMSVDRCENKGEWPVLLTPLDTAGEKPYEEFVGSGETTIDIGLESLSGVKYLPCEEVGIAEFKVKLERLIAQPDAGVDKTIFKDLIASIEPSFLETHKESNSSLDQRM